MEYTSLIQNRIEKPVSASFLFFSKIIENVEKRQKQSAFWSLKLHNQTAKKLNKISCIYNKFTVRNAYFAIKLQSKRLKWLENSLSKIQKIHSLIYISECFEKLKNNKWSFINCVRTSSHFLKTFETNDEADESIEIQQYTNKK